MLAFDLKIDAMVIPAMWNAHTNFGFSEPFLFQVRSPRQTDRRTDKQISKTRNAAY